MKKAIRYIVVLFLLAVVAYNSVYFRKLDAVMAGTTSFNASKYAVLFWDKKLTPALVNAVEIGELLSLLQSDKKKAFTDHSHALGIGNIKYFLVKAQGKVKSVDENQVVVQVVSTFQKPEVNLATEYIFGNAVRDASGTIDINEFANSMDFNNVAAEINKIIREKIIPPFKAKVKTGDQIEFVGAIELNKEHLNLSKLEVIPISLKIKGE